MMNKNQAVKLCKYKKNLILIQVLYFNNIVIIRQIALVHIIILYVIRK